jgi:hypothetical protein
MAQHRALQVDLVCKLRLMKEAVAALPAELQEAAAEPDFSPYPPRRALPANTANLPGYYETKMAEAEAVVKSSSALGGKSR